MVCLAANLIALSLTAYSDAVWVMSVLGHWLPKRPVKATSAFTQIADLERTSQDVRNGPESEAEPGRMTGPEMQFSR
jgi:hypothetical protein